MTEHGIVPSIDHPEVEVIPSVSVEETVICIPNGPCAGVNAALAGMYEILLLNNGDLPVSVNNPIVHYDPINQAFMDMGMRMYGKNSLGYFNMDDIPENGIWAQTAHGGSQEYIDIARSRGNIVVDLTCNVVHDEHDNMIELAEDEETYVLAIGTEGHPELLGTSSYGHPDRTFQVTSVESARKVIPLIPAGKKVVVKEQTTLGDESEPIKSEMKKFLPMADVEEANPCYATRNRQKAVRTAVEQYGLDGVVVITSKRSNNGRMLGRVAHTAGAQAIEIESPNELVPELFSPDSGLRKIGLTSAASVPDPVLQMVAQRLREWGVNVKDQDPPVAREKLDAFFNLRGFEEAKAELRDRLAQIDRQSGTVPRNEILDAILGMKLARQAARARRAA